MIEFAMIYIMLRKIVLLKQEILGKSFMLVSASGYVELKYWRCVKSWDTTYIYDYIYPSQTLTSNHY